MLCLKLAKTLFGSPSYVLFCSGILWEIDSYKDVLISFSVHTVVEHLVLYHLIPKCFEGFCERHVERLCGTYRVPISKRESIGIRVPL